MNASFYLQNRAELQARLETGAMYIVSSGEAPRRTNDEYYPFFADRNFVYLTGIEQSGADLMGFGISHTPSNNTKTPGDTLFIPPADLMWERWNGTRVKADEAKDISGIENIRHHADFDRMLDHYLNSGNYTAVYLPLFKYTADEPDNRSYKLAKYIQDRFPHIQIKDLMPHIKSLRLIKKPCEIEAMRKAEIITGKGITAMMKAAKPGITERELRAEFYYALMMNGAAEPAFPPIISAGTNNFCIHYHGHGGTAQDGEMILNDVGASVNNIMTDVSRGWPVNGIFNKKQRALYQAAYDTSEHLFSIIKPGMPMGDVDKIIREVCFEHLKDIGLCKTWQDIGTYMWHGGAHHVGFDVHDVVAINATTPLAPGMVFCVDVGIYVEEWGIGFRLEDNCLVTETGCENLSKNIPRCIDEIEAIMKK